MTEDSGINTCRKQGSRHTPCAEADGTRRVPATLKKVVYFSGCYANYFDPQIGVACVEVMEKNGFEVGYLW